MCIGKWLKITKRIGIKYADRRLLHNIYMEEVAMRNIMKQLKLKKKFRQMYTFSPVIFSMHTSRKPRILQKNKLIGK